MLVISSSRVFRLLCWAIGLLAVALLGMVGMMVYPLVFGHKDAGAAASPVKGQSVAKAPVAAVAQAARSWTDRFWPVKQDAANTGFDANPVDSFSGCRFVGSILKDEGKGYAIFQREGGTMGQELVRQGDPHSEIKILKLSKELVAVQIGAQKATLRKVEAAAPRVATGRRPPGTPPAAQSRSSTPVPPAASAGSTSRRLASVAETSASSARVPVAASTAPAANQQPGTDTSVNWRQYWTDRIRQQQDRAGQRRREDEGSSGTR